MEEYMTLKQMANLSGYSVSTVSKALNNKGDISKGTKKRILEMARHYNYIPNHLAVSLRKQKTNTIAVVVPDISNDHCARMVSEVQKLSFKQGIKLLVFQHFENRKLKRESVHYLNNGSVDGAIMISSELDKGSLYFSIPNISMELDKFDGSAVTIKKKAHNHFKRLIEKIG